MCYGVLQGPIMWPRSLPCAYSLWVGYMGPGKNIQKYIARFTTNAAKGSIFLGARWHNEAAKTVTSRSQVQSSMFSFKLILRRCVSWRYRRWVEGFGELDEGCVSWGERRVRDRLLSKEGRHWNGTHFMDLRGVGAIDLTCSKIATITFNNQWHIINIKNSAPKNFLKTKNLKVKKLLIS